MKQRLIQFSSLIILLLGLSCTAHAKLYKYQDKEGRWHFSDTVPENIAPSLDKTTSQHDTHIAIHNRGTDANPDFEVVNGLPAPIELIFSSNEMVNMAAEPQLPLKLVIPALGKAKLSKFSRINPELPFSYSYSTRYEIGDPQARHVSGKPYALPFPVTKDFTISQAYDGQQSHTHAKTRYAVDIPMPAGTLVQAARTGVVIQIKKASLMPGKGNPRVQQIRILHNDGTMAVYAYLKPGTEKVKVGDKVHRDQPIGEIGGKKTANFEPHLHFAVQKNTGMKLKSIPFEFISFDGTAVMPRQDLRLRHPP